MLDYETTANNIKRQYLQDLQNGKRPNVYGLSTAEFRAVCNRPLKVSYQGQSIIVPIKDARW